ncbi:MAG: right-handed parallel beta-helix repeat-containing protein, partial [Clostridia bacterium]|nr:right-handed parallel beta-helix repeat-containing protein [Clostridia bacterium]
IELDAALAAAAEGDTLNVAGRVLLSKPLTLKDAKGLTFAGGDGAAFDMMRPITGFAPECVNGTAVWAADIPEEIAALKPYMAFAPDGAMLRRPRLPKAGFYRVKGATDGDMFTTPQFAGNAGMYFGENEVPVMRWPETAQIRAFHWWTDELLYIGEIDYEARSITFQKRSVFAVRCENSRTEGARWYLDNVFEALTDAGEYYITPDCDKIYYVPREGDVIDGFTLFVSTTEKLMALDGCAEIAFKNIEFKGSDRDKMWLDRRHSQAASDVPCAMDLDGCTGITFEGCRFLDIGLSCVGIDNGCHHITFERCEFTGIGGNPIYIKGKNLTHDDWKCTYPAGHFKNNIPEDIQHDITVNGCEIGDYGRVYYSACGILLRYAYNCRLTNNHIHDGYYTGISVGWVWGYAPHATNHILVENNHIHDIGKYLLSDMGGIYTLGHQEGTVLRGNVIHNVQMDSYGGWGVYLDEGSSDILVERNVCWDLSAQPFHQHYGANNLLRNNIFAFGDGGAMRITRKEEHLSVIVERNIFVSNGTAIYANTPESMHITDCMNLVWNYKGEPLSGPMNYDVYTRTYSFPEENHRTVAEMQAGGVFAGVIIADPKFVDAENFDLRLEADSPAIALGFDWAVKQ